MKAACTMDMLATDIADYLVRKGVSTAWPRDATRRCHITHMIRTP